MVSVVKSEAAWPRLMPDSIMPMNSPPTMLIRVMMMPAMASPRTNLLAPSMAPKKSACWLTSLRRRWASRSSMIPAFRSASMAICRPGMPSKAKRAATSLMRVAPLVITTNWMMTMMAKMIRPTTILSVPVDPPVTNSPKVFTTPPAASSPSAAARVRIKRVVATLSTRRKSVVASRSEGKMLNSSGVRT